MDRKEIIKSLPPSESDKLLNSWTFNLVDECLTMLEEANFDDGEVFDFATGTGRMTALLTRLNHNVITGDITDEQREEARNRIRPEYLDKVKFKILNLEDIPFDDNSLKNIECVNTIHHLENPIKCIKELIRVHSPEGKMLLADFNSDGFDVMDQVHIQRHGELHTRGNFSWDEINRLVKKSYSKVKEIKTRLNVGLIAEGKK